MSTTFRELLYWLSLNLIIPVALPISFVLFTGLIIKTDGEWYDIFITLFDRGIFLFVGITALLSLFQDYDDDTGNTVFTPIFYIFLVSILLLTVFLFISSLGIIESDKAVTLDENHGPNILCIIFSTFLALYMKTKLIKLKNKKQYFYVN